MNVDDFIKALEYCLNYKDGHCENCPYHEDENGLYCVRYIPKKSLEIINRQKAEIERLNHIRAEQSKEISALREEIDSLKRFEAMRLEAEELFWEREEMFAQSDKERQEAEAFEKLMQIAEMTEEQNGNL